jgi:competence protein ComEA
MKNSKSQTLAMIGISLIVIAGIIIAISMSLPTTYQTNTTSSITIQESQATSSSVDGVSIQTTVGTVDDISYPIDLNTATVEELMTIDGLGEKRAGLIVAYRQEIGSYSDVSQIKDIKGIGDSLYQQVAPYLTV